jgi:hypothetical protein
MNMNPFMKFTRSSLILIVAFFAVINTVIAGLIAYPPQKADAAPAAAGGAGATLP